MGVRNADVSAHLEQLLQNPFAQPLGTGESDFTLTPSVSCDLMATTAYFLSLIQFVLIVEETRPGTILCV